MINYSYNKQESISRYINSIDIFNNIIQEEFTVKRIFLLKEQHFWRKHIFHFDGYYNKTLDVISLFFRTAMNQWLCCWARTSKVMCSNFGTIRHRKASAKSLTAVCLESLGRCVRSRDVRDQKNYTLQGPGPKEKF